MGWLRISVYICIVGIYLATSVGIVGNVLPALCKRCAHDHGDAFHETAQRIRTTTAGTLASETVQRIRTTTAGTLASETVRRIRTTTAGTLASFYHGRDRGFTQNLEMEERPSIERDRNLVFFDLEDEPATPSSFDVPLQFDTLNQS